MFSEIQPLSVVDPLYSEASQRLRKGSQSNQSGIARDRLLFEALDGAPLAPGTETVCVYGVYRRGGSYFLQLAVTGGETRNLIAELSPTATPSAVLDALRAWLASGDPSTNILRVA